MRKRTLDDPTLRQENEAFPVTWTQGNLDLYAKIVFDPCLKVWSIVAAIDQDFLKTFPEWFGCLLQQALGSSALANIGSMSNDLQQVTHRIDQDVAFAPVHLLATIKAMFTSDFRGFHALTVDDYQAGLRLSPCGLPNLLTQCCVHRLPRLIPTPFVKMVVYAIKVRILMWQIRPLASRPQYIQNRVHYRSQLQLHRSAWPIPVQQWFYHCPRLIT